MPDAALYRMFVVAALGSPSGAGGLPILASSINGNGVFLPMPQSPCNQELGTAGQMTPAGIKWNHLKVKWGNGDVVTPLPGRALQSAKAKHEDRKQRYCTTFHPCKAQIEQCWADHPDIHLEIFIEHLLKVID